MAAVDGNVLPGKHKDRGTLYMPRSDVSFMVAAGLLSNSIEAGHAQRVYDGLVRARDEWLRERGRRLPTPEQIDSERYGQREARHERRR